jgi:dTDP-glucose 4,6-dehydratase
MKILITGGAGFIGSHVVEHLLKNTDWEIISLDRLSVSGNYARFTDMDIWAKEGHRLTMIHHDLRSPINELVAKQIGYVDYVLHMAASTHVDRSIVDPMGFALDNVVATTNILEFARKQNAIIEDFVPQIKRFIYFSTDEVFGPAPEGVAYKEWDRYNSGNPYAAAKAGGEEMALAYSNTYKIPMIITHTMNVFGERQHPEKFIPMTIKKILAGEKITIHANKEKTKAGSRMWIHARNVAAALTFLLSLNTVSITQEQWMGLDAGYFGPNFEPDIITKRGIFCDKFNIVGERELDNLEMAKFIYEVIAYATVDVPRSGLDYEMVDFHSSRPGHDLRYALDGEKMKLLGWSLPVDFETSLKKTVYWYLENKKWLGK